MTVEKKRYKLNNCVLAFSLNAIFLMLVILFCDMKYEVSDDFIVDTILSGAYGNGYDEHLLFSNILYGYFLKFLYQLLPVVSWYFVGQIAICFCALTAVTYVILEKNNRYIGILVSIVFVSFFSDDLYILVQFTKTAAAAACAGGALLLYGFWECDKKCRITIVLGAVLALVGSMIRYSTIYIALVYLVIMFLKYVWENRSNENLIKKGIVSLVLCGVVVAVAYGLNGLNEQIWLADEQYGDYRMYNRLRASVTDVNGYGYGSVQDKLQEIGISQADYYMVESWNFLDQQFFTEEKINEISEIKKEYSAEVNHSLSSIISQFLNRGYEKYIVAIGAGILILISLLINPKKSGWLFAECGVTVGLLLYFFCLGRVVYRVEYGVFFSLSVCVATAIQKKEVDSSTKKAIIYWCIVLCVCKIPLYIPDRSYQQMTDEEYAQYIYDCFCESWNFNLEKYRCNVSERQPHEQLISQMENDTDHYYLIDFSTGIQLIYYNYKPWIRLPEGYYSRYSYLGGVTTRYPDNSEMWEKQGVDSENPYACITNDNIYVVDNYYKDAKLWYIQEQYYSGASAEVVEVIDGFTIWKYYN